ncbi:hypothetical protein ACFWRV_20170 [Streptomyces sp. NPDC058576]|uniref:hypothetical protein n=1 Tax=Streptomyces sp. NPDC058576 TaxID=3346547 RepID=UPI00364E9516
MATIVMFCQVNWLRVSRAATVVVSDRRSDHDEVLRGVVDEPVPTAVVPVLLDDADDVR